MEALGDIVLGSQRTYGAWGDGAVLDGLAYLLSMRTAREHHRVYSDPEPAYLADGRSVGQALGALPGRNFNRGGGRGSSVFAPDTGPGLGGGENKRHLPYAREKHHDADEPTAILYADLEEAT